MTPTTIDDIFSLNNPNSITRRRFEEDRLDLRDYSLPTFEPDESYKTIEFEVPEGEDHAVHFSQLGAICQQICPNPRNQKLLRGAVREAFKNAYQHGNKKDPTKKIFVSYRKDDDKCEVVIGDQGGIINPQLIPFVLSQRAREDPVQSFYQFACNAKHHPENSGLGTFILHLSCEDVRYYRNAYGGLSVHLTKQN